MHLCNYYSGRLIVFDKIIVCMGVKSLFCIAAKRVYGTCIAFPCRFLWGHGWWMTSFWHAVLSAGLRDSDNGCLGTCLYALGVYYFGLWSLRWFCSLSWRGRDWDVRQVRHVADGKHESEVFCTIFICFIDKWFSSFSFANVWCVYNCIVCRFAKHQIGVFIME